MGILAGHSLVVAAGVPMIEHFALGPALLAIPATIVAVVIGLLIAGPPSVQRAIRACFSPPPIDGDPAFTARVTRAWEMAEGAPNAHILQATKRVVQGDPSYNAGAVCIGDTTVIHADIRGNDKGLAAALMHEAAHAHRRDAASTPEAEAAAMREENILRRHLGISTVDETDFSWWAANYPGWPGGTSAPQPVEAAPQPPEPRPAPVETVATPTETMVHAVAADIAAAATARPGGIAGFVWDAKQLEKERADALAARRAAGYIR